MKLLGYAVAGAYVVLMGGWLKYAYDMEQQTKKNREEYYRDRSES